MKTAGSLEFLFLEKPEQEVLLILKFFQKTEVGDSSISIFFNYYNFLIL
jgi:hypothetical protein